MMKRFLFLLVCLASALTCQAQTVSHTFRNVTLAEALTTINNEQSAYTLTFVNNDLERLQVSATLKRLSVPEAVEQLCKGQPVRMKVKGRNIYVQYHKPRKVEQMVVSGYVYDHLTHVELVGATVQLLAADSTALDTCEARSLWMQGEKSGYNAFYLFAVPKLPKDYLLRVSYVGYEPTYFPLSLKNLHKREYSRELPPLYMKRQRNTLQEVQVTASKVMFYYRGDTLVYNADAFQLAEGSMLDALIKQMPGVELKKNGQIYHNGKFVKSLLLNGKEFFRGDNTVMLDNLPAYTVKEVKVYDKLSEQAEWLGSNEENDKYYVMDVQLKKEYSIGWLGNVEAGAGASPTGGGLESFLARLFAMRFSDHSRIGVYANANNLNDNGTPGESSSFNPHAGNGRQTQRKAGLDYNIDDRDKRWKVSGNAQAEHTDNSLLTTTDCQNFLSTGDTYEHAAGRNRDHNIRLNTSHTLQLNGKRVQTTFRPSMTYSRWRNHSHYESSAFAWNDTLLYHNNQQGSQQGHRLGAELEASSFIKVSKFTTDKLELKASASYSDQDDDRLNRQHVQYAAISSQPSPSQPVLHAATSSQPSPSSLLTDQHFRNHPDRSHRLAVSATYSYIIKQRMSLDLTYGFSQKRTHRDNTLYALQQNDSLALPSITDAERTLDFANSYNSLQTDRSHDMNAILWWFPGIAGGRASISLRLPFTLLHQRLHYQRGTVDTLITRRTLLFHPDWGYAQWRSKDQKYTLWFAPRISATPPALSHFVDIRDATDPLNIHLGNSRLKDTYTYDIDLQAAKGLKDKQLYQAVGIRFHYVQNALAMSMLYDETTGVRTYRPYNVNGNCQWQAGYRISAPLDKARRLILNLRPEFYYIKSVDLTGTHGLLERSKVTTLKWEQFAELRYKVAGHQFSLGTDAFWQRISSRREGFESFNVADVTTTFTALLKLPWKLELSTDMNLYTRRGYNDPQLNTDEWVWNARLSRPFLKGRLLLMVDGFDLLGQRSNITRAINAQGRVETWTNSLPRYVLLHAVWRWNVAPKKR